MCLHFNCWGCQRGEKKKPISSSTTLFFQSFTLLLAPLYSFFFFLCLVQNHWACDFRSIFLDKQTGIVYIASIGRFSFSSSSIFFFSVVNVARPCLIRCRLERSCRRKGGQSAGFHTSLDRERQKAASLRKMRRHKTDRERERGSQKDWNWIKLMNGQVKRG